jgi:hypothetical protein
MTPEVPPKPATQPGGFFMTRTHTHTIAHQRWQRTRLRRIDQLCTFLRIAVHMAELENDPHGWWSHHVAWAITRLDNLDYRFPELEHQPPKHALTLAEVIAA